MNLRGLDELVDIKDPAIDLVKQWMESAEVDCELLPPSANRDSALRYVQVTTRSPLGALAYDSGGLILQNGWVRLLGSGHSRLQRRLDSWNQGRADGFLLVADDAVGGFFAINGGALGDDLGQAYYWAPDDLSWLSLEMSFTELLTSLMTNRINEFYADLRWPFGSPTSPTLPAISRIATTLFFGQTKAQSARAKGQSCRFLRSTT